MASSNLIYEIPTLELADSSPISSAGEAGV
jgi:hypothetical protein